MDFECGYSSSHRKFILPTVVLSGMALGFGYLMVSSAIKDFPREGWKAAWPTVLFLLIWQGVIGGCAAILLLGFVRPVRLFVKITETEISWRNHLMLPTRSLPRSDIVDLEVRYSGSHPVLTVVSRNGKRHTIRSAAFATTEDIESIENLLGNPETQPA